MWPVLFSVFGIQIQSYGASKALAALVAAWLLGRAFRRLGFPVEQAHSLVLWAAVWGFAAAKVYFLIDNRAQFSWHLLGSSGFVWYGGLIGGVIAVVVLTRRYQLPLATVAGAVAVPLSVAYGIGRIGCFLAGDGTYGRPTDLPWGMAFPNGVVPVTVPVHPAQLYEAAGAFAIAGVLWLLARRRWLPLSVFGGYLALSGFARLLVEMVRVNDRVLLGLTEAQLFGLLSILAGLTLIVVEQRRGATPRADAPIPVETARV